MNLILICHFKRARDAAFIDFFTGGEHRFKSIGKTQMMIVSFGRGIFYRTYSEPYNK
jgi:hypothetical protein